MVKLLRTDTTLDLSQKARVVRIQNGRGLGYIRELECARTMSLLLMARGGWAPDAISQGWQVRPSSKFEPLAQGSVIC